MFWISLLILTIGLGLLFSPLKAQILLSENFQSYTGFGSTLTGGWQTSGPGGFKVYLRSFPDSSNKVVEVPLSPNKVGDSIISPEFGPLGSSAQLRFRSRLVEVFTGITATVGHTPSTGDAVSILISTNGGTSYQFLQNLLPNYPSNGTSMVDFLVPLAGLEGQNVRFKIKVSRTAGSWFPNFDDFVVENVTSIRPIEQDLAFRIQYLQSDHLELILEKPTTGFLQLISLNGRILEQQHLELNQTKATFKKVPEGVYMLRLCSDSKGCITQKIRLQ